MRQEWEEFPQVKSDLFYLTHTHTQIGVYNNFPWQKAREEEENVGLKGKQIFPKRQYDFIVNQPNLAEGWKETKRPVITMEDERKRSSSSSSSLYNASA